MLTAACSLTHKLEQPNNAVDDETFIAAASNQKCFFCGYQRHPRAKCPARNEHCKRCNNKGHFAKMCRSSRKQDYVATTDAPFLSTIVSAASPASLSNALINTKINGYSCKTLIDTGSSESYISEMKVKSVKI